MAEAAAAAVVDAVMAVAAGVAAVNEQFRAGMSPAPAIRLARRHPRRPHLPRSLRRRPSFR